MLKYLETEFSNNDLTLNFDEKKFYVIGSDEQTIEIG